MKLLRNIIVIIIIAIILFSISVHFAERSSGNTVYIFMIAGVAVVLVSRILINLSYFKSIKKDLDSTPQELVNKSVKMEKYYVGEIVMLIAGVICFIYGYKEYTLVGLSTISILYFIGSIICFATIIKFLISKKSRINKITNMNIPKQNNLKMFHRIVIFITIGFIILNYLYSFFN